MTGKPKDYIWCFLIGGLLSALAEIIFEILLAAGVPFGISISLMLACMAILGTIMTVTGHYERWEALSGMGAILPFCGCVANISETMAAALNEGKTIKESIVIAMKSPFYIFGWGIMVCMILAGITHLAG